MSRRTPQAKKELDYKKQRRTHWDNDKAARKAIPAAKARKNRTIRRESKRAIQTETVEELTIGNMRAIDRVAPADKYGRGESLEQHLQRRAARRVGAGQLTIIDKRWNLVDLSKNSSAVYNKAKHRRLLHDLFVFYAALFTLKSLAKPWIRRDLDAILQLTDSQLLAGFLSAELRWKRELEVWQKRVLLLKNN